MRVTKSNGMDSLTLSLAHAHARARTHAHTRARELAILSCTFACTHTLSFPFHFSLLSLHFSLFLSLQSACCTRELNNGCSSAIVWFLESSAHWKDPRTTHTLILYRIKTSQARIHTTYTHRHSVVIGKKSQDLIFLWSFWIVKHLHWMSTGRFSILTQNPKQDYGNGLIALYVWPLMFRHGQTREVFI